MDLSYPEADEERHAELKHLIDIIKSQNND